MKLALRLLIALAAIIVVGAAGWGLWAVDSWIRYGHPTIGADSDSMVGRALPHPEVAEYHERLVNARPAAAFHATQQFALSQSAIVRTILRTREFMLGARDTTQGITQPLVQQAVAGGWSLLAEVPSREFVFGTVTRPWEADVRFRAMAPERFAAFDSAGWVKIVWSIAVDSLGPQRARLRTETRVATTDPTARARFRRYWAVFSPGIILIRHEALRIIARDASG